MFIIVYHCLSLQKLTTVWPLAFGASQSDSATDPPKLAAMYNVHMSASFVTITPKVNKHSTKPHSIEGWVDLAAVTPEMDYLSTESHPSEY